MRALILIIVCTIALFANELQFKYNFSEALQIAKKQNKEVMMMYSATWCPECNYMKEVVFKNRKVIKYIEKYYVVLLLDIQKDKLPEGFNYIGIPTFFFIDKYAKQKSKIIGGSKANIFLQKLKALK